MGRRPRGLGRDRVQFALAPVAPAAAARALRHRALGVGQQDELARVLIAMARARWCWAQLPVTRRERILPRSLMYLRSMGTSL